MKNQTQPPCLSLHTADWTFQLNSLRWSCSEAARWARLQKYIYENIYYTVHTTLVLVAEGAEYWKVCDFSVDVLLHCEQQEFGQMVFLFLEISQVLPCSAQCPWSPPQNLRLLQSCIYLFIYLRSKLSLAWTQKCRWKVLLLIQIKLTRQLRS